MPADLIALIAVLSLAAVVCIAVGIRGFLAYGDRYIEGARAHLDEDRT